MSEWQPIETAPKDDGIFVLCDATGRVGAGYFDAEDYQRWWWLGIGTVFEADPTHWMPLPSPPETAV